MSNESPTSGRGPRQAWQPTRVPFARLSTSGAGGVARFRVTTPDPRLRVRISVLAVPDNRRAPATAVLSGRGCTLWPVAMEQDLERGLWVPVSDVIPDVTSAAPQDLPEEPGLAGWSREFSTIADAVDVVVNIPPQEGGETGRLVAQAMFMPQVFQIVPWDQWAEIRSQCELQIVNAVES